jgi:hypothetical protein
MISGDVVFLVLMPSDIMLMISLINVLHLLMDTSLLQGGGHIHDLTIGYDINGKDYVLDLRLNR